MNNLFETYGIKSPTMLSVSAQQTRSFIELSKINTNYLTAIFMRKGLGDFQDYCNFIDKLSVVCDEIIKDIGEV